MFTDSSYFYILLSTSCFLLLHTAKGCLQGLRACSKNHRGIQALGCLSMTAQINKRSKRTSNRLTGWVDLWQPLCPAFNATELPSPAAAILLSRHTTPLAKLQAFPHFRSGFMRNHMQKFYQVSTYIKTGTSRGMVGVSFHLMLNSILIWAEYFFPPKTRCP